SHSLAILPDSQGMQPPARQLGKQGEGGLRPSLLDEGGRPGDGPPRAGSRGRSRLTGSCGDRTLPVYGCVCGTTPRPDASNNQRRDDKIIKNGGGERVSADAT